ncbi:methyl-accepting chemotaxis protein [Paludibacterium yongneupense]|uniref:methyl-accepting chemotaxis protein n=1 Tax=Paludibacterium yongneupense TaxID=400061 RepID=UPI00041FBBFF|nr:HAMP domain-containing methyl-accepting chemotaxis protein [Paludibacterium yongneupense]
MKISAKLYLLLGFGMFGLLLNAAITFYQMSGIHNSVDDIALNLVPSVTQITDIHYKLADARRAILRHLLAQSAGDKNAQRQAVATSQAAIAKGIDNYRKNLVTDEQDKANLEAIATTVDKFYESVPHLLTLSDQGKNEEARDLLNKEVTPLSTLAVQAVDKADGYCHQLSNQAQEEISARMVASRWLLTVVLIGTAAILLIGGIWLVNQIKKPLELLRGGVTGVASSLDFTQRIKVSGHDEISETVMAVNHLLSTLQDTLVQIRQVGSNINGSAHNVANASQEMSRATQQVSEATASMSAAVEQMTVSVTHVADRAEQADGSSRKAGADASDGSNVISNTIAAIRSTSDTVTEAAGKINELKGQTASIDAVVGVIRDIAEQTNLLALNAAIEAARAGDTGRGFAVVADEVRKLAERTATSTQEISSMIGAIQSGAEHTVSSMQQVVTQVDAGVSQAEQATAAIVRILDSTSSVVGQVSEISGAMREQSQASNNIAQQIERVAQMTEETSASTQATASSAEDLRGEVDKLNTILSRFRVAA